MSKVFFNRNSESGNIFVILGKATRALDLERRHMDAVSMKNRVLASHSYDEALEIIAEYVDLEEV